MKYLIILLLCSLSFSQVKRFDEKGNISHYADTLNGLFNGKFICYNKNKTIAIQGNFKENQKNGIWIYNDSVGKTQHKRNYKNNYEFENLLNKNDTTPKFILSRDKNQTIIFPKVDYYDERLLNFEDYVFIPNNKKNSLLFKNDYLWNKIKEYINKNDSIKVYEYMSFFDKVDYNVIKEKIEKHKIEIVGYKLKRYSYYNSTSKIYEFNRVLGICPIASLTDFKFNIDLFWIYYPSLSENINNLNDVFVFNN